MHMWTVMTSLYYSVRAVDAVEWPCVLCGHHIQDDWVSRAMNLHQILCEASTFLPGNYSDDSEGCSCAQLVIGSFIMITHLLMHHILCSFFEKHQITQVTLPHHSPYLTPCDFKVFPKLKSPLKGKRFQTISDSGKYDGSANGNWENFVRSQAAYFEGDWGIIVLCTMFLVFLLQ